MSVFEDELQALLGTATDAYDITAIVRRFWFYDFLGVPVRVWQGQGIAYAADGTEWLGTIDANEIDHHQVPAINDGRDGSSKSYEFGLPYLDAATFTSLKADASLCEGRTLTCYLGLFKRGDGQRLSVPLDFFAKFTMQRARFEENASFNMQSGSFQKSYKATVLAKDFNRGRSQAPRLTFTAQGQRLYAEQLGVTGDAGADFVAGLANRTYTRQDS